jgi:hypothetical protein
MLNVVLCGLSAECGLLKASLDTFGLIPLPLRNLDTVVLASETPE